MIDILHRNATANDFVIFSYNLATQVIGRIIRRPYSSIESDDILVKIYTKIPPRVHLLGSLSTFGLVEITCTDQQAIILPSDISDFCFIFDIHSQIRSKAHIQGISNAFIIDCNLPENSSTLPYLSSRHGISLRTNIFNSMQQILKLNDSIMNNMKAYQHLNGKQQSYMDVSVWKYLSFKISQFPEHFAFYSKEESKISRRTHWDFQRESLSHPCFSDYIVTSNINGYNVLRNIIGVSIGVGIRSRPPKVSDHTRSLNENHDIINYVSNIGDQITLSFVYDTNTFSIKIKYSRGHMSDPSVRQYVRNIRQQYMDRVE